MRSALAGEEIHFLEIDSFIAFLKSSITNRGATKAAVFAVNALVAATAIPSVHSGCNPEDLVPSLAKIVRTMLGPSGIVLRVGPGILVCIHLSPRSVDPELLGMQVDRSIKRVFGIGSGVQNVLKGTFDYNPAATESEEALRHFLSSL